MSPQAVALGVGPSQGDTSWWSNSIGDVATRACFFDDEYVFNADGSFSNVLGTQSWIEGWQGGTDSCGAPVSPHNGSNAASWTYNSTANTITLNGIGAFLGLAKVFNGGELASPAAAPASITYTVTSFTANLLTLDISIGGGWWRFVLQKQIVVSPLEGTWKMSPQAVALGVGPSQGDTQWFSNSLADVTTRACFFDDEYIFNANGTFSNVLGTQSWIEGWQGGTDACGTPVAPHNGSNPATWAHNTTANTITLNGVGAFLGLAKVYNGGELSSPAGAQASITYIVTSLTSNLMTLDISIGGGWWRFVLAKQGVTPTCTDGIQNGDETGIDCGGSCPNACLSQINLPVTFEGSSVNYTVTDFGGNASTKIVDPTNASNMVMKSDKTVTAELWAGTTIGTNSGFSSPIPFTATNRKMYVRVWSPDANIPVRLKVEVSGIPTQSCETQTNTTVANAWETIEFDFNNQASGTAAFNPAFPFNMASIFFNFGTTGATAGAKTYYFDDVSYGTGLAVEGFNVSNFNLYPNPTKNNLTIESLNEIQNISIFNLLGQEVQKASVTATQTTLDVSSLENGVYFVTISSNGITSSKKFIKE